MTEDDLEPHLRAQLAYLRTGHTLHVSWPQAGSGKIVRAERGFELSGSELTSSGLERVSVREVCADGEPLLELLLSKHMGPSYWRVFAALLTGAPVRFAAENCYERIWGQVQLDPDTGYYFCYQSCDDNVDALTPYHGIQYSEWLVEPEEDIFSRMDLRDTAWEI